MVVVTGREFRASQAKYFGYAGRGEDVIIKSRAGSFRLVPVRKDDAVYNEQQLTEMIDRSLRQISEGKFYEKAEEESAEDFLNRMLDV